MGKLDNMKMGHVSREMETLSENQEDRIKAKNTVRGMKRASYKPISRLDMTKEKESASLKIG